MLKRTHSFCGRGTSISLVCLAEGEWSRRNSGWWITDTQWAWICFVGWFFTDSIMGFITNKSPFGPLGNSFMCFFPTTEHANRRWVVCHFGLKNSIFAGLRCESYCQIITAGFRCKSYCQMIFGGGGIQSHPQHDTSLVAIIILSRWTRIPRTYMDIFLDMLLILVRAGG